LDFKISCFTNWFYTSDIVESSTINLSIFCIDGKSDVRVVTTIRYCTLIAFFTVLKTINYRSETSSTMISHHLIKMTCMQDTSLRFCARYRDYRMPRPCLPLLFRGFACLRSAMIVGQVGAAMQMFSRRESKSLGRI
jgi:hypothetical protein